MNLFARHVKTSLFVYALLTTAAWPGSATPRPHEFQTTAWHADNGQNSAWIWGIGGEAALPSSLRLEAGYLQGQFNQGGDLEENNEWLVLLKLDQPTWRPGIGFKYLEYNNELRRGFVWSYPEEEIERNADIYGPVVTVDADFPVDWLVHGIRMEGLIMPYDFGDLDDVGYNGSHAELGIQAYWNIHAMRISAGYLYRHFFDVPDRIINDEAFPRDTMQGFTVSADILF